MILRFISRKKFKTLEQAERECERIYELIKVEGKHTREYWKFYT